MGQLLNLWKVLIEDSSPSNLELCHLTNMIEKLDFGLFFYSPRRNQKWPKMQ